MSNASQLNCRDLRPGREGETVVAPTRKPLWTRYDQVHLIIAIGPSAVSPQPSAHAQSCSVPLSVLFIMAQMPGVGTSSHCSSPILSPSLTLENQVPAIPV